MPFKVPWRAPPGEECRNTDADCCLEYGWVWEQLSADAIVACMCVVCECMCVCVCVCVWRYLKKALLLLTRRRRRLCLERSGLASCREADGWQTSDLLSAVTFSSRTARVPTRFPFLRRSRAAAGSDRRDRGPHTHTHTHTHTHKEHHLEKRARKRWPSAMKTASLRSCCRRRIR